MNYLNLNVTKQWFDPIDAETKDEEYREIKDFWTKRLCNADGSFKNFDAVRFMNGMAHDAPITVRYFGGIRISTGRPEWGAVPGKRYYVITLGMKLSLPKSLDPAQLNLFI